MNKKGFTLVELIGVIVVLGVIAMITVPRVMESIKDGRRDAFSNSVKNMLVAVQNFQAEHLYDKDIDLKKGINLVDLATKMDINNVGQFLAKEDNGTGSTTGGFIVSANGTPEAVGIGNDEFCASGKKNSLVVTDGPCEPTFDNLLLNNPANWESGQYAQDGRYDNSSSTAKRRMRFKKLVKVDKRKSYTMTLNKQCSCVIRPYAENDVNTRTGESNASIDRSKLTNLNQFDFEINYISMTAYGCDNADVNAGLPKWTWTEHEKLLKNPGIQMKVVIK